VSGVIPVVLTDRTEDWPKQTFDFYGDDGLVADTIDAVAKQLLVDRRSAAVMVSTYPYPEAIPPKLRLEAARELSGL